MKKLGFTILAAAVLALPLCAQVATVRADIPFEFAVGHATVAPGQYVIRFLNGPVVQLVGHDSYYVQANPDELYASPQKPKLVFLRYGNQYFLSQIVTASTSRDFPVSRVEREMQKTAAAAGQIQTQIIVAAR